MKGEEGRGGGGGGGEGAIAYEFKNVSSKNNARATYTIAQHEELFHICRVVFAF